MTAQLETGTLLNARYKVLGLLGVGGFAAVYEAHDELIDRLVAVKVLNIMGSAHNPEELNRTVQRFKREAKTAARIDHRNVVAIFDMGTTERLGQPFIVMERLYGHDMEQELAQQGPMSPVRLLPLFRRCLQGLSSAHKQGIVHKDLKPSNLFLNHPETRDEDIRIVDFGIARLDESETVLTGTGQIFGTPQYMAPEYIETQAATPALDVYQMGLILVEMLSGQVVVGGDNPLMCVMKHSQGDLNVPEVLVQSVLGPIIIRALSLKPEDRYPTAEEFQEALGTIDPTEVPSFEGQDIDTSTSISLRNISAGIPFHGSPSTGEMAAQQHLSRLPTAGGDKPVLGTDTGEVDADPEVTTLKETQRAAMPDDAAADGKKPPIALLIGIGGLLLVAAIIGLVAFGSGDGNDAKNTPPIADSSGADKATADKAEADKAAAAQKAKEDADKKAEADAIAAKKVEEEARKAEEASKADTKAPEEAPAEPIKVELVSRTKGTIFYEGKKKLGMDKVVLEFDSKDAPARKIVAQKNRYRSQTITVEPGKAPKPIILRKVAAQKAGGGGGSDKGSAPTTIID